MKDLDINATILLNSVSRKLVECLEILNKMDEREFEKIVRRIQTEKPYVKNVLDNVERGNLFMMLFFIRELVQCITTSND